MVNLDKSQSSLYVGDDHRINEINRINTQNFAGI
jgi:hypothetical protein